MDHRHLEHFIAVAEELSFSRAAQKLSVAQSTVSTSVRALERELDTTLLHRTTRVVRLSERGQAFLPEAKSTLEAFHRAEAAAHPADTGLRGTLNVGTLSGLSLIDVPGLLRRFRNEHPNVKLYVVTSPAGTRGLLEKLRANVLDVAFVGIPDLLATTDIEAEPLATLRLDVMVPSDHPLAKRAAVTLADIAGETFIDLPAGFGARVLIDAAFQQAGLTRRVAIEVTDLTRAPEFVGAGLGVAVTSAVPAATQHPVRMVRLVEPELSWTLYIATPRRRTASGPAAALIDLVPHFVDDQGML